MTVMSEFIERKCRNYDILLTLHLNIRIYLNVNQLDALNFIIIIIIMFLKG